MTQISFWRDVYALVNVPKNVLKERALMVEKRHHDSDKALYTVDVSQPDFKDEVRDIVRKSLPSSAVRTRQKRSIA